MGTSWISRKGGILEKGGGVDLKKVPPPYQLCGKFMEVWNNIRKKKLHRTNESLDFLGGSFNNNDNGWTGAGYISTMGRV